MALLQRIKTPFAEGQAEELTRPRPRLRSVGELLRERREELDLDLDGISAALRIKPAYLVALEQDRSHELPGAAYAIGFIRAYAQHLGLDAAAVLNRFKEESAGMTARPDLSLPVPLGERSLPGAAMLLVALILALCGYGTWYYLSTGERSRPDRVAAVPADLLPPPAHSAALPAAGAAPGGAAAAEPPGATPAAAGPPSATLPTAAVAPATPAVPALSVAADVVTIKALGDCWIQVRGPDDAIVFSRVLKAGETYDVPARPGLILRTGNAGALQIAVGGKPVPSIGGVGRLRRNVVLDPARLAAGTAING
ncbi:MAG TPA: RodZ domain-containing protein [Stellaceae bacterium]|nr:RodZ domain-containing protein [Stellaceae bacterium]